MLGSKWGFTVIQFIIAMTVAGLLLLAVFINVAQRSWRDTQRRSDLHQVDAMLSNYASNHLGKYPPTKDAVDSTSSLRAQFDALRLTDPLGGKYYVLGDDFESCEGAGSISNRGPGYISYKRPGTGGRPYDLRMCLEWGKEYFVGD